MKKIRIVSIFLILSFLLAPILGSWPTQKVSAAVTALSVNTGSVIQPDFLGLGAVYHGFSYMPESNAQGMTDSLRTIDFDRVNRAQVRIARSWYGSDWAMPTWGGAYDWNSTKMTAFYTWLQAMKDRGVDVGLNMGWWFREHVCSANRPTDTVFCTPTVADEDIYTKWVSDSLNQLITVKGFTNIKYIFAFTEPDNNYKPYYDTVITKLDAKLIADGRRSLVKIVASNSCCMNLGRGMLQYAVANMNSVVDIYSSHDYSLAGYDDWYTMVTNGINDIASTGKPFWLDEYGKNVESYRTTADYGTYIAEINAAAINAKAQNTLIWLYEDQYYTWPLENKSGVDSFYNGLHKWGTQYWLPNNTDLRPSWYSYTMMTRFLGGAGTQVYDTTKSLNGIRISATKQADGNWSVMVVNSNTTSQDISVNFTSAINKTLYRHLYDPNNLPQGDGIIGASAKYTNVSTAFTDTLPARGVAIYTSIDDGSAVAPYQLAATTGNGQASLSWKAPLAGATSYNIKRSTSFGGPYTTIQTGVTTTSYLNTGLTVGQTYYYVVSAVNGSESGNSNQTFSIQGSNLVLGKTVTASSSLEDSDWGKAKVTDGERNSIVGSLGWTSNDNLTVNHTEWVTVDLGTANIINRVKLHPRNDATHVGWHFPVDFTIQVSADNVSWTTVVTQTAYPLPSNTAQSFGFSSINARYVKVVGTNLRFHTTYRMQFSEIEVYNKSLTASASSTLESSGWGLSKVVDGERNSLTTSYGWSSNNSLTTNHTEWLKADLGGVDTIRSVDLYPRNDATHIGWYFPVNFTIQVSTDEVNWTTVVTQTSYPLPSNMVQRFNFSAVNARYVKVVATNLRFHSAYRAQFAEMEVY